MSSAVYTLQLMRVVYSFFKISQYIIKNCLDKHKKRGYFTNVLFVYNAK